MEDATSLLFDLAGFGVVSCVLTRLGVRRVGVMQGGDEQACPRCGVLVGGKPYDVCEMRVKDLPVGHRPVQVVWCKRRFWRRKLLSAADLHRMQRADPAAGRLTLRLGSAASRLARARSDVAAADGVSWWSVSWALLDKALTVPVSPLQMLGLKETQARSVRWLFDEGSGWRTRDDQLRRS